MNDLILTQLLDDLRVHLVEERSLRCVEFAEAATAMAMQKDGARHKAMAMAETHFFRQRQIDTLLARIDALSREMDQRSEQA